MRRAGLVDAVNLYSQAGPAGSQGKRALDVIGALILLAFFAPLGLLAAVIIRLGRGGPVFVRESAVGLRGRPFDRWRLRAPGGRGAAFDKALDQAGLTYLPSALNVLAGDMSLIGPTPHSPDRYDRFRRGHANYLRRFEARPGMIGPSLPGEDGALGADLDYVQSWSALVDLKVAGRFVLGGLFLEIRQSD